MNFLDKSFDFVKALCEARKSANVYEAVYGFFEEQKTHHTAINAETAKAFIIKLTFDSLGIGEMSDIVLCSLGLLRGYQENLGLTERRLKFIEKSGMLKNISVTSSRKSEDRDRDLANKETHYYKVMADFCDRNIKASDSVREYLEIAKKEHLRNTLNGTNRLQVILPRPSFLAGNPMPPHTLPQPQDTFIGRIEVLKIISAHFKAKKNIQILYGMGGVGKTQIALHYAYSQLGRYSAVAWINANTRLDIYESCIDILKRANQTLETFTEESVRVAFLNYFERGRDWMIVFDNADYIDNSSSKMREILESYMPKSGGHILITTRCNVDFTGATRTQIDVFSPEIAAEFMARNAGQEADADTELLAKKLGYLPLALKYAASYIREHTTYRGYLKLWKKYGLRLFDQDNNIYAEQTIRQAFHISLDKIKDDVMATNFLYRLSCLDIVSVPLSQYLLAVLTKWEKKSDDLECLHSVLNDEITRNELIAKLSRYSLVNWDKTNISMHPLLREIIFNEMPDDEKRKWYSELKTPFMLAEMCLLSGDQKATIERLHNAICRHLDSLEELNKALSNYAKNLSSLYAHYVIKAEDKDIKKIEDALARTFNELFERTLKYDDEELTKQILLLQENRMDILYDSLQLLDGHFIRLKNFSDMTLGLEDDFIKDRFERYSQSLESIGLHIDRSF